MPYSFNGYNSTLILYIHEFKNERSPSKYQYQIKSIKIAWKG